MSGNRSGTNVSKIGGREGQKDVKDGQNMTEGSKDEGLYDPWSLEEGEFCQCHMWTRLNRVGGCGVCKWLCSESFKFN